MNKIIGFLITKEKQEIDIDIFNVGLNKLEVFYNNYYIYLWGINDLSQCLINGSYSLSFPLTDDLLDRNVLISFNDGKIMVENDWLSSIPIFYNSKDKIISTNCNYCLRNNNMHKEGISNYLEFGFTVFQQTIFEDIHTLRYYSRIELEDNIKVILKNDPIFEHSNYLKTSKPKDVIREIKNYTNNTIDNNVNKVILPLTAGYDSRLLCSVVNDKKKIESYTYGISKNQSKSIEVVYAKKLSDIYNFKWKQIELKDSFNFIKDWLKLFGFSTHIHGMHFIEFYSKIVKNNSNRNILLNGIGGDWFNGKVQLPELFLENFSKFFYTHNLNMPKKNILNTYDDKKQSFIYEEYSSLHSNYKNVSMAREKVILISYLNTIPEYFGIVSISPFLNMNIALGLMNVSSNDNKLEYLKSYFEDNKINLEDMKLNASKSNNLTFKLAQKIRFENINVDLFSRYVDFNQINSINNNINNIYWYQKLHHIKKLGFIVNQLISKTKYVDIVFQYLTLKILQIYYKKGNK